MRKSGAASSSKSTHSTSRVEGRSLLRGPLGGGMTRLQARAEHDRNTHRLLSCRVVSPKKVVGEARFPLVPPGQHWRTLTDATEKLHYTQVTKITTYSTTTPQSSYKLCSAFTESTNLRHTSTMNSAQQCS